jgi:hypothetical protein
VDPRTPRIAALVAAPLLVVAATGALLASRSEDRTVRASADGPLVAITSPEQGAILDLERIQVVATADDPDGIATAELRIDGDKVDSVVTGGGSSAELRFFWTPTRAKSYEVQVRARDLADKWGEALITVSAGTGQPPLPPPPTTSPRATIPIADTSGTTVAAVTTDPEPEPTTPEPVVTTRVPLPTRPVTPTTRPTLPPTQPTTTLAPTTTIAPTTTTLATTTTTTTTTTIAPPITQIPCRLDPAILLVPFSGSSTSTQPTFAWTYFGSCPPSLQILSIRASGGGGSADIPLAGSTRSYRLTTPLPACARVRWEVIAIDTRQQSRGTRSSTFVTTGC